MINSRFKFWRVAAISALLITLIGCGQVMITGRKQVLLFSQGEITSLSNQAYVDIMSQSRLSSNNNHVAMVREVGERITSAVYRYAKEQGMESALAGYNWKFDVIADNQVNAFCLPNGNIVFYEGIMAITNTPDLVAIVMGHEIAHAIAKHGNERMSQEVLLGAAGQAISAVVGSQSVKQRAMFDLAFGIGTQLGVILPYSRKHEYEADRLGLIFMAMAGYNPNLAPAFWERMSQGKGGAPMGEFFSTHPSDANRIKAINKILPEVAQYQRGK